MELRLPSLQDLTTTPETVGNLFNVLGVLLGGGLYYAQSNQITTQNGVWMIDLGIVLAIPLTFFYIGYRTKHHSECRTKCRSILLYSLCGFVAMFLFGNWIVTTEALADNTLEQPVFLILSQSSFGAIAGALIAMTHTKTTQQPSTATPPEKTASTSEEPTVDAVQQSTVSAQHSEKSKEEIMNSLDKLSRRIIQLLEDNTNNTMTTDELIDELLSLQKRKDNSTDNPRSLSTNVIHSKIPSLSQKALVTYNQQSNTVTYIGPEE